MKGELEPGELVEYCGGVVCLELINRLIIVSRENRRLRKLRRAKKAGAKG